MKKIILAAILALASTLTSEAQSYIASWNASPSEPYGVVKTYSMWWEATNPPATGVGSWPQYINSVNAGAVNQLNGVYQMTIPIGVPNAVNLYMTTDGATNSSPYTVPYFFDTNQLKLTVPLISPSGFSVKINLPSK